MKGEYSFASYLFAFLALCVVKDGTAFQIPKQEQTTGYNPTSTQISDSFQDEEVPTLVILLPKIDSISKFGGESPVESPSLYEAARHLAKKATYFADGLLSTQVVCVNETSIKQEADIVLAYGLATPEEMAMARSLFRRRSETMSKEMCQMAIDCVETLPAQVGLYDTERFSPQGLLPWTTVATGRRLFEQMSDLFQRWTTDDFCAAIVLFLNQFVGPVEWVRYSTAATWEKGALQNAKELYDMATKCGDCLGPCLKSDSCRTCLTKLTEVDPRDQALSYRTIVSYESELLTKFSLCAFTKHNIFNCDATIPTVPKVKPLTSWRNSAVTAEVARSLLVGHLKGEEVASSMSRKLDVSWKVACGANVAYDQFPCQNQLFYPSGSGNTKLMWYDPVFRVQTLDGRNIWCKRHYRVKQQEDNPATFRLSVSDNGVTSDEFWTIAGAADDLSWIVFHYAGAAKTVGLRYLGGLLCTPDGSLPREADLPAIWDCFQSTGIQPWELYVVDNRVDTPNAVDAGPPPLDFYRQDVLELRRKTTAVESS